MHWRRKWQPTPAFLPGESQGRGPRTLAKIHCFRGKGQKQKPTAHEGCRKRSDTQSVVLRESEDLKVLEDGRKLYSAPENHIYKAEFDSHSSAEMEH